jgi:hypothetical protein
MLTEGDCGEITSDAARRPPTLIRFVAIFASTMALMVVDPSATPFTTPDDVIVAMDGFAL